MLNLRVVRKFYEPGTNLLLGYTVREIATGKEMNVHKNELKNAVIQGKATIENMTLTSDGRLIGKAGEKKAPRPTNTMCTEKLLEVYTNGRNIVGGMIQANGVQTPGFDAGVTFENGQIITEKIKGGRYSNIQVVDGTPDTSSVKRRTFKNIRARFLKTVEPIKNYNAINVEKVTKSDYNVSVACNKELLGIVKMLLEDAMVTDKIKVVATGVNYITVSCSTGIADVRKAVKNAFK